jgi:hypothetical protein
MIACGRGGRQGVSGESASSGVKDNRSWGPSSRDTVRFKRSRPGTASPPKAATRARHPRPANSTRAAWTKARTASRLKALDPDLVDGREFEGERDAARHDRAVGAHVDEGAQKRGVDASRCQEAKRDDGARRTKPRVVGEATSQGRPRRGDRTRARASPSSIRSRARGMPRRERRETGPLPGPRTRVASQTNKLT